MRLKSFRLLAASLALAALLAFPQVLRAHDTWVQTSTNLIRVGDAVHIDLMLGNHGKDHRDFKLASKLDLAGASLTVVAPNGKKYDLRDRLIDTGYTPKEGYWSAAFATDQPGLYLVGHTYDAVMSYAPERAVKSAKTFFVASRSLDRPPMDNPGFDRPLGHPLEIVPLVNPVTPMGPGTRLKVRLLYKGKPLAGEKIAFLPRGVNPKEGTDDRYERITDGNGEASFEPEEANYYLIVAHKEEAKEGGKLGDKHYSFTRYGATLTVFVPQICPCCGG